MPQLSSKTSSRPTSQLVAPSQTTARLKARKHSSFTMTLLSEMNCNASKGTSVVRSASWETTASFVPCSLLSRL